jgi:hypothetical protein
MEDLEVSERILKHIEYLSKTIGSRGSCTEQERQAHDYCQKIFEDMGHESHREPFSSHGSAYRPFIVATVLILLAEGLFFLSGLWIIVAAVLTGIVMISALLDPGFISNNPLRWVLPTYQSRNVYAIAPPDHEVRGKLVVISHVDTHRTPWIWTSPATYKIYRLLSTLGIVAFLSCFLIYTISIFAPSKTLLLLSLIPTVIVLTILFMVVQAERSPHTCGANDNASGVGFVLSMAERLKEEPLPFTEVWLVVVGCEEVGADGSMDFVHRHKAELADAAFLIIDGIGAEGSIPYYLTRETLLRPLKYPEESLKIVKEVAAEHPELDVRPFDMKGVYTDGTPVLMAGLKCLAFVNHDPSGWIPNWHQPSDNLDHIDPKVLERTELFIWEIIRKLTQ